MKKFLLLMFVWLAIVVFTVFKAVTAGRGLGDAEHIANAIKGAGCGTEAPQTTLHLSSKEPGVRKLAEVEEKCKSEVTRELMYFTIMPKDKDNAISLANKVGDVIEEFNKNGIKPIVVVEPDSDWGLVDFTEFNTGFWDPFIEDFFEALKARNITDEMMGTWVPFPEANLPYWNHQNTKPEDFAKAVNRYTRILKEYYPSAKASVLLNSATYETDDYNWAEGEYVSLKPYLEGIEEGLIDSFGLQGLPWMPPANSKGKPLFEPVEWLNPRLASEASDILKTKKIWFNTGSFAAKYAQEPEMRTVVPAEVRGELLGKILTQARELEKQGYDVTINLFSEDKSAVSEGTDWSYFGSEYTTNDAHTLVLLEFLRSAHREKIGVSFFFKQ